MDTYLLKISVTSKTKLKMTLHRNGRGPLFGLTVIQNPDGKWLATLTRMGGPDRVHGVEDEGFNDNCMSLPSLRNHEVLDAIKWGRALMSVLCQYPYSIEWDINA